MTSNEYQKLALRTEKTPMFVRGLSAIQEVGLAKLLHASMGVTTESGELADQLKKHIMYGKAFDRVNIIEEIGDVLWYLAIGLDAVECTLEECMAKNIAKLQARFPEKFTQEQALVRDLDAEREALESK